MHKRTLLVCISFLTVRLLTGCPNGSVSQGPTGEDGGNTATIFDVSTATATVSGKISFEGTPPPNDKIQMSSDPYCQMHAADYPTAETVRVSDGGLENVIIYVSSGLQPGLHYATPSDAVE